MKGQVQTGTIKIWFGLLKLAIAQGLPINEAFYRSWGTRDELAKLTFNRWWLTTGRSLFEESIPAVSLVDANDAFLMVKIPTSLTAVQVKRQVSEMVINHRGAKRLKSKPPWAFVGDVNYKRLKQYERYLDIEFDPRNAGKTVEEKTELLRDVYREIKTRLDKQKKTLMASGKKEVARRLFYRDPDSFGSKLEIRRGIEAKKVNRWKLSGKILLLNVAEGGFPGNDYYGAQLAKKLRHRLDRLGLEDIGGALRNRGGGRKKQDLTLVRIRKSKLEAEIESLRAYGKGKVSNPVGDIEK
jgi:hypothetical protein